MSVPSVVARPATRARRVYRSLWALLAFAAAGLALLLPAQSSAAPTALLQGDISRIAPGKHRVALTFDGDAFVGRISDILLTLRAYQADATFFLTGYYMENNPTRTRAIITAGHEVASHGYRHLDYRDLSDGAIVRALAAWNNDYYRLTGKHGPPIWRAPYGYTDNRVRVVAGQAGYSTIYWTLDALDTVGPPKSATYVFNQLTRSGLNLDGAILLLHVNPNGTVDALPRVLANLNARGLDVVSVSGLLAR